MTLLEAVNLCLRSTGESEVASVDSAHPQVQAILAEIHTVSTRLQRRGWWFNTQYDAVLSPIESGADAGKIDTSGFTLVKPVHRWINYYSQGGFLVDGKTRLPVMNTAVTAFVRWSYPDTEEGWADMPESFTDYVAYAAAVAFAGNYDADPTKLQVLSAGLRGAQGSATADHTKMSGVNLFASGSTGIAIQRAWGRRYGLYR